MAEKLRFGIMCKGSSFYAWQATCIENLINDQNIDCELLIVGKPENNNISGIEKITKYPYKNFLFRFYKRFLFKAKAFKNVNLCEKLKNCSLIECEIEQKKYSQYFSKQDIETIKSFNLDFILRFGFGIIRGEILNAARYGVWSFHHDDEQKYRGGPACFWEFYKNENCNGAILQQLTDKLDGGIVLRKGWFPMIKHSFAEHSDFILFSTSTWPHIVARELLHNAERIENCKKTATQAPIYKTPNNLQFLWFSAICLWNKLAFHFKELFLVEIWNIAIVEKNREEILLNGLQNADIKWIMPENKNKFAADPFCFSVQNKNFIIYEEYSYKNRKASINLIELNSKNEILQNLLVFNSEFHLSYPFVFQHNTRLFCVPESYQSKNVNLYVLNTEKYEFEYRSTLIQNFEAVDTTLFFHNNKWWLFCTTKTASNHELYIFFSNNLFSEFTAHKINPVKTDIASARPAGSVFMHQNRIIRPAQDSRKTYGTQIVFNEILHLSEYRFEEKTISSLKQPPNSNYPKALHTFNTCKNFSVIDGKRFTFNFENFKYQLKRKLNRLLK